MLQPRDGVVRIGVFYDGNYFLHVSNYYNYFHQRRRRISIAGLHSFIRQQIAEEMQVDYSLCHVVDAHYFRGRMSAYEASQRGNQLYNDRLFDDVLMSEGVVTHYLPLRTRAGRKEEKGIDVWLALEALELSYMKKYDVLVLITSDGDFVPLIRKVNTIGTRVMVLSWDFEYTDDTGREIITRTSQDLLEEVTYPVAMHEIIDSRASGNELIVGGLFVTQESAPKTYENIIDKGDMKVSKTLNMKSGYGFVAYPPNNLFFHYLDVVEGDFNEIHDGDTVEFTVEINEKGNEVAKNVRKVSDEYYIPEEGEDEMSL
ncbi:MAG TPA: NYN domain-containing protein [Flavobacteriales bacterium]|nr:NYN domain-containing protein [Flavobacteriales bacterium]